MFPISLSSLSFFPPPPPPTAVTLLNVACTRQEVMKPDEKLRRHTRIRRSDVGRTARGWLLTQGHTSINHGPTKLNTHKLLRVQLNIASVQPSVSIINANLESDCESLMCACVLLRACECVCRVVDDGKAEACYVILITSADQLYVCMYV
jgi:hypothetical protein